MKNLLNKMWLNLLLCFAASTALAQTPLPVVNLPAKGTLHFISPEPIQYVDISSKDLVGDLPLKNVFRLRQRDSLKTSVGAIITIAGERFIAQYQVAIGPNASPQINIEPSAMQPLDVAGIGFSEPQLKALCLRIFAAKPDKNVEHAKAFDMEARLNHVYTAGDYVFLDVSLKNRTNLKYSIDDLRFAIVDKKVVKAANNQAVPIKPEFVLFTIPEFSKGYRNIYVLRKLSFPGNKLLTIEYNEKPISGRVLKLDIRYQDILNADTLFF